jgi:hypothetical protein
MVLRSGPELNRYQDPCKHAVMARHRFGIETVLAASFRYRIGAGPLRHVYRDVTLSQLIESVLGHWIMFMVNIKLCLLQKCK